MEAGDWLNGAGIGKVVVYLVGGEVLYRGTSLEKKALGTAALNSSEIWGR